MKNLTELNVTLNKMTANKSLVDSTRASIVNEIISLIIGESKDHEFTNKRIAQKWIIEELLSDENKNLDNYTKRAIKVSKAVLVDGYKFKKELLTIAQAENLVKEDKAVVNGLMSFEDEDYTEAVKHTIAEQIKRNAISKLAELEAIDNMKALYEQFGEDTRKVLTNMLKAL